MKVSNGLIKAVLNKVILFLSMLTPTRLKRMILISTLLDVIDEQKVFNQSCSIDIDVINRQMNLASNKDILKSTLCLTDYVWGNFKLKKYLNHTIDVNNDKQLNSTEAFELSNKLLRVIPCWLHYDRQYMVRDITFILCLKPIECH